MGRAVLTAVLERHGTSSFVSLKKFEATITHLRGLLKSLDQALGHEPITWVVSDLQVSSGVVGVLPETDIHEHAETIVDMAIEGINHITHEQALPDDWNEPALRHLMQLAEIPTRYPREYSLVLKNGRKSARVTERTYLTLRSWLHTPTVFEDFGSVEGTLEMITVRGRPRCRVYEIGPDGTQRAVECVFGTPLLGEIKHAIGERVEILGTRFYNKLGNVTRIHAQEVRILPRDSELPSLKDISCTPIDLTGDTRSDLWVRRLRNEE